MVSVFESGEGSPAYKGLRNSPAKPNMGTVDLYEDTGEGTGSIADPKYKTENFMMYGFKIATCCRQGRHPWNDCVFAHPTENARRRDPRLFSYNCRECPSYRNCGFCPRGDECEFSHGIFEARLHPDSFRTAACKDGAACKRKVCFFYHNEAEKRQPTGLSEARAQLAAELGDSVLDLDADQLRQVANDVLQSSANISRTVASLTTSLSQPLCASQTLRSTSPKANAALSGTLGALTLGSTGATRGMAGSMSLSADLEHVGASAPLVVATETVAPCLKGANRNKAQLRQVAEVTGSNADMLMHGLRIAALHGELSEHSTAPSAGLGSVPDAAEAILADIAAREECDLGKLRGWLLRCIETNKAAPTSPRMHATSPAGYSRLAPGQTMSPRSPPPGIGNGSFASAAAMLPPADRARAGAPGALTMPASKLGAALQRPNKVKLPIRDVSSARGAMPKGAAAAAAAAPAVNSSGEGRSSWRREVPVAQSRASSSARWRE